MASKYWICKMRSSFLILCFGILVAVNEVSSKKLPDYLHGCKKTDPELNKCINQFFDALKSHMDKGIPEIGLPAMDPLNLKDLEVVPGQNGQNRIAFYDVNVKGLKNTKFQDVKFDPKNMLLELTIEEPHIDFTATYDINYAILNSRANGKGPATGSVDGMKVHVKFKGKLENGPDYKFFDVVSADVISATSKSIKAHVDKLFKDESMNKAVNNMLNNPNVGNNPLSKEMFKNVGSNVVKKYMNQILNHIPYDELLVD